MTILGKDIIKHEPFVKFCVLDEPISIPEGCWQAPQNNDRGIFFEPDRQEYEHGIFFEFADCLLSTYCGVTQSYSPFDPYAFIQYKPSNDKTLHDVYKLTSNLLMWEYQLAKMPANYFGMYLDEVINDGTYFEQYTREQLKADMLETLHFLIGKIHEAAAAEKCVVIVGI